MTSRSTSRLLRRAISVLETGQAWLGGDPPRLRCCTSYVALRRRLVLAEHSVRDNCQHLQDITGCNTGEGQRQSLCSRIFDGIVCSLCGAEGRRLVRGGACCAGALTITSEFVHVTRLAPAMVLGERWVPALILCAALSPIQILSIQTASTAERDFGESRLHYTYQLDFQHNPTSLH